MQKVPGYLNILVECMFVVALADRNMASQEMEMIKDLVSANWNKKYGDIDEFIRKIAHRLTARHATTGLSLEEQFEHNVVYLSRKLNADQKQQVLRLIHKLVHADRFIAKKERKLIELLQSKFDPDYVSFLDPEEEDSTPFSTK